MVVNGSIRKKNIFKETAESFILPKQENVFCMLFLFDYTYFSVLMPYIDIY